MSGGPEYKLAVSQATARIQDFITRRGNELSEDMISQLYEKAKADAINGGMSPIDAETAALEFTQLLRDEKSLYLRSKVEEADVKQLGEEFLGELEKVGFVGLDPQVIVDLQTYFIFNLLKPEGSILPLTDFAEIDWSRADDPNLVGNLEQAIMSTPEYRIYQQVEEIASLVRTDKESIVLRWPTMFTKDKQMGELAKQLDQAGVIDLVDRQQDSIVMQNLDRYWDTILQQLDDVSSENERNFANVADKLVNAATDDESTSTKQRKKADFGWLENIANPNMQSPENFKAAYEVRTSDDVTELVENPGDLLEKQIKELFPDALLTPAQKIERGKLIAEGRLQLIRQQGNLTAFDEPGRAGINQEIINQIIIGGQDMSEQGDIIDRPGAQDRLNQAKAEEDRIAQEEKDEETYNQYKALTTAQGKTAANNWIEEAYGGGATVPDYAKNQMADDWLKMQQYSILNGMGPAPDAVVFGEFKDAIESPGGWFDEITTQEAIKDPDLMSNPDIQKSVANTGFGMTPQGEVAQFGTYKDPITGKRIGGATFIDPNTGQIAVDAAGNPIRLSGKALYDAAMDHNSPLDWLTRAATITAATQDPNYTQSMGKPGTQMPSPPAEWFEGQIRDYSSMYPYAEGPKYFEMGPPGSPRQEWNPPPGRHTYVNPNTGQVEMVGAPTIIPSMGPQDIDESSFGNLEFIPGEHSYKESNLPAMPGDQPVEIVEL